MNLQMKVNDRRDRSAVAINVGKQAAKIGEAILNDEDYEKTTYIDTFLSGKIMLRCMEQMAGSEE